jgi:hypothetical protein
LAEEQWDRLITCVCYVEMMRPDLLTPEQANELKRFLWAIRPRKKGRRRSEWESLYAMLEAYIEGCQGNVSHACKEFAKEILHEPEDWERLRDWYNTERARRNSA